MRKCLIIIAMLLCVAAMTVGCSSNNGADGVTDTTQGLQEEVDTVCYYGDGITRGSKAEYAIAGSELLWIKEGDKMYDNLEATVMFSRGEDERPTALTQELKAGVMILHGQVMDQQDHGDEDHCWLVVQM